MPSFDVVNYSLRPSKSVQRHIVFEALRSVQRELCLSNQVYIGLGSVWFADFIMAHKQLGIDDMVSIEADDVGYARAVFNSPYSTVKVKHGKSTEILPELFEDDALKAKAWIVWLDYDYPFDESVYEDVRAVVENAPENSILLATVNAIPKKYGKVPERPERLRAIFGDVVPDGLAKDACKDDALGSLIAGYGLDVMTAAAANKARPGGFVPCFRVSYADGAQMMTIGGVLPSEANRQTVEDLVGQATWRCRPAKAITVPHLTLREAAVLQSKLPRLPLLTRADVVAAGFDLADEQIEAFSTYYREYPAFAQIVA